MRYWEQFKFQSGYHVGGAFGSLYGLWLNGWLITLLVFVIFELFLWFLSPYALNRPKCGYSWEKEK